MLKLVVIQPGQPDREVLVPGEVATIGRVAPCDVVIDQPYVSKRHLRILHGTIAVDLGSSNGTFVDGQRVTEATLLEGRTIALSPNGVTLRVETEDALGGSLASPGGDQTLMAGAESGDGAELVQLRAGYGVLENEVARLKRELEDAQALARPVEEADLDAVASEQMRSEHVLLEAEVARLKRELEVARDIGDQEEHLAHLSGENESLRERLESLKKDMEAREEDDGGSLQARLALQRVESVQELNEKLQQDVDRLELELEQLEGEPGASPAAAAPMAPAEADAQLQAARAETEQLRAALGRADAAAKLHQDQTTLVRKLRQELEAAQAGRATGGNPNLEQALEASRQEAIALRARAAELEGRLETAAPPADANVSDLFFKLQTENGEMRRKIAALEKGGAAAGAPAPRDAKIVKDLMEARLRIAALESELSNVSVTKAPSTASVPAPTPSPVVPKPTVAASAAPAQASGFDATRVLRTVIDDDIEGLARPTGGPVDEFVFVESVRLLRQVERVVTRVAGDLIQLFQLQTILPDTVGSYRGLVGDMLADSQNEAKRESFVEYLEQLGRWLVASIGAHRKGAVVFAESLKADLSEKGLTAKDPLPAFSRVPMLAGNELWRRTQDYLKRLTPDAIDERIDDFARTQAQEILSETPQTGAGRAAGQSAPSAPSSPNRPSGGPARVDGWKRS